MWNIRLAEAVLFLRHTFSASRIDVGIAARVLLLLQVALSPLIFWTRMMEEFELIKVALLITTALLVAALGLSSWVGTVHVGGWRPRLRLDLARLVGDPVSIGMLTFAGSALFSTITSESPRLSLFGDQDSFAGLITAFAYVVLYFATRHYFATTSDSRWLLSASITAAGVTAGYALLQMYQLDPFNWMRWNVQARPTGTMGNSNFLAAFLAMTLPLVGYFVFQGCRQRQWLAGTVFSVIGLVVGLSILFSLSRGAWLASAGALLVPLGAWLFAKMPGKTLLGGAIALALTIAGAALFLAWIPATSERVRQGITQRMRTLTEMESRRQIWISSLQIFEKNPVFGSGLDTFRQAFSREQTLEYWGVEWGGQPMRAHNEVLHILATQGLIGIAGLVALTSGLIVAAWRAWRRSSLAGRPMVAAMIAGIIAFYIQDLFSFTVAGCGTMFVTLAAMLSRFAEPDAGPQPKRMPANQQCLAVSLVAAGILAALAFWRNCHACLFAMSPMIVLIGLGMIAVFALSACCTWRLNALANLPEPAETAEQEKAVRPSWVAWLVRLGIWSCTLFLLLGGILPALMASALCRRGMEQLAVDGNLALHDLERAASLAPWHDFYELQLGIGNITMACATNDEDKKYRLLVNSRKALERAVQMEPRRGQYRIWLGRVLTEFALRGLATHEQVYAHFDIALAVEAKNALFYADACTAAMAFQEWKQARQYAQDGCTLYPKFAPTRAQLGHIALLEKRFPEAVEHLRSALGLEWADQGDERIEARVSLAEALLKLDRCEEALAAAREAVGESPNHAKSQLQLAAVLHQLGRREEAIRAYRRALELQPELDARH